MYYIWVMCPMGRSPKQVRTQSHRQSGVWEGRPLCLMDGRMKRGEGAE